MLDFIKLYHLSNDVEPYRICSLNIMEYFEVGSTIESRGEYVHKQMLVTKARLENSHDKIKVIMNKTHQIMELLIVNPGVPFSIHFELG